MGICTAKPTGLWYEFSTFKHFRNVWGWGCDTHIHLAIASTFNKKNVESIILILQGSFKFQKVEEPKEKRFSIITEHG